ncbi:MAG: class I SAM-dependent rRNA methyltransferase [Bacillota bacterium]|nr:class I SAM-dependent rRNA methyltransferase [Bacillota bacterium]
MTGRATVVLKRGRDQRLRSGHAWVYAGEVDRVEGEPAPGDLVALTNSAGHFLGLGYYNPASQIVVRRLTEGDEPVDREFFRRRLARALSLRAAALPGATSCRLVFGEGDGLPGLIVDRFEDVLVWQVLTLGMEVRQEMLAELLVELVAPAGLYARNDAPARRLEGLALERRVVYGTCPPEVWIRENDLWFWVDLAGGQKTGYFFDQKLNRRALAGYIRPGARVLDPFCYTGSFAVHAAAYGAAEVLASDISEEAVRLGERNAAANGFSGIIQCRAANGFDLLRQADQNRDRFDLVILDPPAFTRSKHTVEAALRGYKEINLRALKLLGPGGILVTCSCSHHLEEAVFREMVASAAADAHRRLRLREWRGQAPDHPILVGVPETQYLKCGIYEVL